MKARVNLTIDEGLLAKVKRYASNQQRSLSELVESYFKTLDPPERKSLIDMVEELPPPAIDTAADLKEIYMQEKAKKHGF